MSRGFYLAVSIAIAVTAVIAGWSWYVKRTSPEESLYVPKLAVMTPELQLLRRYVQIDTTNPPGNETAGARFLIDELHRNGIEAELIESAPGRGNVYARIRGRRRGEGLMLLNHIDVVAADPEEWTKPPFSGEVDLNMMYGRGTLDMKGVAIAQLLAFIELARSGRAPERDVVFLATADEEQGSRFGIEWLLGHRPDVIEGVRYALNEGGITETIAEGVVYFAVEVGSRQMVWIRLTSPERGTLRQIRLELEPEFTSREPQRVLPEVRAYFKTIAPKRIAFARYLEDIDRTIEQGEFWRLPDTYRALTRSDILMNGPVKKGDRFEADLYLINLPDEDPGQAVERFRERFSGRDVEIQVIRQMGPARISSTDTPFFRLLSENVQAEYGRDVAVGPILLHAGTTDSRYLRGRGVDVYGVWPFPVDFHQSQGIHGVDERVRLDWFMSGVSMMKRLVREYTTESS